MILSRMKCVQAPFGLLRPCMFKSGLAKVIQSLSGDLRGRIAISSELIADDTLAWARPDRQSIHETILKALSQRMRLALWHRDQDCGSVLATKTRPVSALARIRSRWCLVGHSSAERQVRVFETAWIERLELTDEPYSIPPRFRLERFLEKTKPGESVRRRQVQLRFTPGSAFRK